MFVLTGREMAAADARARKDYALSGLVLMENAGREAADAISARYRPGARIDIVCGPGNNGGDGFVAARHLALAGREVVVWLAADRRVYRGDARVNLNAAAALGLDLREIDAGDLPAFAREIARTDLIVDALFGTGFHGEPRSPGAEIIRLINESGRPVAAVDIPSGVSADTGAVPGPAVRAAFTITFAAPKLGCVLYPGRDYCGELIVRSISLPAAIAGVERRLTEPADVAARLWDRPRDAHKGQAGRVLVIGGSPGFAGAPVLAARGALRAGAGLVTALLPAGLPPPDRPAEVMTAVLPAAPEGGFATEAITSLDERLARADAVAVGPGLGTSTGAWALLKAVLAAWHGPLVLDADALNLMAAHWPEVAAPGGEWILTPHPGEMARLIGRTVAEVQSDRVGTTRRLAEEKGVRVVLKGAPTVTAGRDGRVWLNPTGCPAMAAGGMGDVLTGIVAGLLAQGLNSEDAAVAGVYLHGMAGEMTAAAAGGPGIFAGEVADMLPAAVKRVREFCQDIRN